MAFTTQYFLEYIFQEVQLYTGNVHVPVPLKFAPAELLPVSYLWPAIILCKSTNSEENLLTCTISGATVGESLFQKNMDNL